MEKNSVSSALELGLGDPTQLSPLLHLPTDWSTDVFNQKFSRVSLKRILLEITYSSFNFNAQRWSHKHVQELSAPKLNFVFFLIFARQKKTFFLMNQKRRFVGRRRYRSRSPKFSGGWKKSDFGMKGFVGDKIFFSSDRKWVKTEMAALILKVKGQRRC